jgi:GAF domain-containing protein
LQDFAAIVVRPMDYVCGYLFFLLFALKFPSENAYFKRRHVPAAFFTMGALIVVSAVLHLSASRGLIHLTPASNELLSVVRRSCGIVSAICSLALLGYSWRTSQGTMRTRIGWVLPSIGISYVVWSAYLALDQMGLPLRSDLASYGNNVAAFVGYAGFSYALLRHKVFTFGFAINRALVYTLISTMVLVAFGITEFAVDKLLHFEGRQKNIIFDAIVALLIILSFHRIQHWSAEKVDHTFFHRWYDAAEKLRRFVEQSAHITSAEVLRERFADAFEVFATSAGVATYAAGVDGSFTLRHTTLPAAPAHIDVDHPLAVALRHRPQAVQLEELAAGLPGALALPMTLRGALAGIILMAGKNSQQAFRPDEVSLMESSAHSLAVQLDGVRVQELQKFAASLQGRQSELESKLALVEREANDLRTGNLDLREANVALRTLAGIG